ncbi:hypothetical protein RHGRI_037071 [Rhododendron griersonianum]|uniref:Uncharacterized protein n=1 Tax=Rhododendron griersonianum TaxID=479676 RepID=A0AAV6HR82_9ERIC|nr:hypothetical protein RHGRI_037071 [Rhododendron griersonianum]
MPSNVEGRARLKQREVDLDDAIVEDTPPSKIKGMRPQENHDVEGSSKIHTRFGSVAREIKAKKARLDVEESAQKRTREKYLRQRIGQLVQSVSKLLVSYAALCPVSCCLPLLLDMEPSQSVNKLWVQYGFQFTSCCSSAGYKYGGPTTAALMVVAAALLLIVQVSEFTMSPIQPVQVRPSEVSEGSEGQAFQQFRDMYKFQNSM